MNEAEKDKLPDWRFFAAMMVLFGLMFFTNWAYDLGYKNGVQQGEFNAGIRKFDEGMAEYKAKYGGVRLPDPRPFPK